MMAFLFFQIFINIYSDYGQSNAEMFQLLQVISECTLTQYIQTVYSLCCGLLLSSLLNL